MERVQTKLRNGEGGFTLVELAIVMIIIGLLITGVLKGQTMIANAQITSTIAQSKGFEAALNTFRDQYNALPGDMIGPATRIAACSGACAQAGGGNGQIGNDPGLAHGTVGNENGAAWAQLSAADLISGVSATSATTVLPISGDSIPAATVNGSSWQIGYSTNGRLTAATAAAAAATDARSGHYVVLDNSLAVVSSATTASLTPGQAARIDRKLDDGKPNSGTVRGMGGVSATACADVGTVAGVYNEALQTVLCGLYIRIQ